jgi:Photosynthetic reaction centre cytochrome C subunit
MTIHAFVAVALMFGIDAGARQTTAPPDHASSRSYNRALGVECEHCHSLNDFREASKPTLDFARRMERMLRGLNEGPLQPLGPISCWSCHRGAAVPARLPPADWQSMATRHAPDFAARPEGIALTMSVYAASLGVDCSHCHVADDWTAASKAPHQTVKRMLTIFDLIPAYFDRAIRVPRTQCYMCHQGRVRVERAPG